MHILRKILWPFSVLYGLVVKVRNILYDRGIFRSVSFGIPVICVGNLSVGGTGKTPMVEYLVRLLKADFRTATLSRGYRRKSKGFVLAGSGIGVDELGDEPCQYHEKFPDVAVAVDADRVNGINRLMEKEPYPEVVILDDAMQHRRVKAGMNILLTSQNALYTKDIFLPAGNLRDSRSEAKRADIIVVTKCREDMTGTERQEITGQLAPKRYQKVFFTSIAYSEETRSLHKIVPLADWEGEHFTLVTGIANATPLVEFLKSRRLSFEHCNYPDHHEFSDSELETLRKKGKILTTEKDFMRLKDKLEDIFFIGIQTAFLFGQQEEFNRLIRRYVEGE
ncbi:tetraacyldisaccharide 4'-kinase [Sinomicrobium weinanense]|uniref:Tetraacyldisaccharide 4'-kinase n=1 Tax=Sinomicrobium weinanense TaxID=2842200 RepID=A0A926Q1X5_9FLAO|nr:tetraacyldisaccharide 4'-kinase [Sinomicrobium weinanense]MBC9796102.1 tetraacyldisaccharide 4'-kinase [Sinomicrobium weinanense]MBU3124771.1 tetraacyldisaccharide 4'-kinase [Sinomicrobium weinanense]